MTQLDTTLRLAAEKMIERSGKSLVYFVVSMTPYRPSIPGSGVTIEKAYKDIKGFPVAVSKSLVGQNVGEGVLIRASDKQITIAAKALDARKIVPKQGDKINCDGIMTVKAIIEEYSGEQIALYKIIAGQA